MGLQMWHLLAYAKAHLGEAMREERGAGEIVAVVLIIVAVIALGVLFGGQILNLFNGMWNNVTNQANNATNG